MLEAANLLEQVTTSNARIFSWSVKFGWPIAQLKASKFHTNTDLMADTLSELAFLLEQAATDLRCVDQA